MDSAQETPKVAPKFTKKTAIVVVALVVILIIVIVVAVMTRPITPAPAPAGTPMPLPPTGPAPMPNLPVYRQQATGVWVQEGSKAYMCPSASGADLTGNNGDYANYCIFDKETDAQNFCTSDASCVGYAAATGNLDGSGTKYQVTRSNPIPSTTNGTFFAKSSS